MVRKEIVTLDQLRNVPPHMLSGGWDEEKNQAYKRVFLVRAFASQVPVAILMTFDESDMEHLNKMFTFATVTEVVIKDSEYDFAPNESH